MSNADGRTAVGLRPMYVAMQISAVSGLLIMWCYLGSPAYWNTVVYTAHSEEDYNVLHRPLWEAPIPGSHMPASMAFALRKEMLESRANSKTIIITFANFAFIDFVVTWAKSLSNVGVTSILVGAMDKTILEALYWKGIPVFNMNSGTSANDLGWGSDAFHVLGREKVYLIRQVLLLGYEVLLSDSDVIWFKDPLPYFRRYPNADILTSTDLLVPTVGDDSLEKFKPAIGQASLNIGCFFWRPSEPVKTFVNDWINMLSQHPELWDQAAFNRMVGTSIGSEVDDGLFYAYNTSLKIGILPVTIFANGNTFFVQALYKDVELEPYAAHATFQYSGSQGKRHRIREIMMFEDPPEYYDDPQGFISFDPAIPLHLLHSGNRTLHNHFALVNYQILQIRDALAIATILKRTLIMPPLWCKYDRLFFPHPGIYPGSKLSESFICPMDHVFELQNWLKDMPNEVFGPRINFREHSFLINPRLPRTVRESVRRLGALGTLRESELKEALGEYKNHKVLEFSSMRNVFGGFDNKVDEEKFERRMMTYGSLWCCLDTGHINYDMYWDKKKSK